jgi:hypothetical protein
MGVLTNDGATILHSLRNMGNDAAHEVKPHREEELKVAFDVVENLLESVYLLPLKAKKLPKKIQIHVMQKQIWRIEYGISILPFENTKKRY